ncbi:GntR family transcriptional regulator [Humibacillus xanthopallidus]|uniref:GntR family transcriptional regulator n=1 Tax=Humibacillus xanthopallidus TaxID=412689 RepID=A0A543PQV1_9MICO|nr:FCD domain-containing protein [Humibacillus xanthopallidus]TQN46431.1 GntR family transcriptional regulator [Humibacillus xanthopallidus]
MTKDQTVVRPGEAGGQAFERVLRWVDDRILSGELRVGDHLPPERELAKTLGVSRAAVREAVRTFQAQGVVRSAVGAGAAAGTTVTAVPAHALTRLLRLHVALANFPLPDVVEVRISLERLSARLASRHASDDDVDGMRQLLDHMAQPGIEREEFNDADTAFHVAIAASAGNLLAADLTAAMRESMRLPILDRFRRIDGWEHVIDELRHDHEAIYAAITDGQADDAARLVEDHIRRAWQTLGVGAPS